MNCIFVSSTKHKIPSNQSYRHKFNKKFSTIAISKYISSINLSRYILIFLCNIMNCDQMQFFYLDATIWYVSFLRNPLHGLSSKCSSCDFKNSSICLLKCVRMREFYIFVAQITNLTLYKYLNCKCTRNFSYRETDD